MRTDDRLLRYPDSGAMLAGVADRLIERLLVLQADGHTINVCIAAATTGSVLGGMFIRHPRIGELDASRMVLWWGSENFVDATDPQRNSTQLLSQIHASVPLPPGQAHTMPQRSGYHDPDEAAYAYAEELDSTKFDLCLVDFGETGRIAGIYPGHPSLAAARDPQAKVIGVTGAPGPVSEQITLTFAAFNTADQIWVIASGVDRAAPLAAALAHDPQLPSSYLHATQGITWLVDEDAASSIPTFHCSL
jgi:6-phosphogluconolactonase